MKKKIAIVSIVLIALMCGYLVPMGRSFSSGPVASNNTQWNEYGPNIATLWWHGYANYAAELAALESKTTTDFMDTTLVPSDYTTMVGLGGFNFTFVTQLAIDEIDWNNAFLPFNNTGYKAAVANILQSDLTNFVSTYLGIGAAPAYSPIPGCIVANSGYPWYDPNTANIYNGGYAAALSELLSSGIPLTADLISGAGAYATWNFTAPYPVSGGNSYNPLTPSGTSATGYNVMGDGADNNLGAGTGGLFILTRTSDQRQYIGPEVKQMLGANFAAWYNALGPSDPSKIAFKAALTGAGLSNTLILFIECTVKQITMAQIYDPVFSYYCYEMYTAGYSYGMLPSAMLENYVDGNAPQSFAWGPYHDIQMKGIDFLRGAYAASGLCIKPKTKPNRIEMLKEMIRALGLNPEEILTKEALAWPHRIVIADRDESQIETLLRALKQELKQELAEIPIPTPKTV